MTDVASPGSLGYGQQDPNDASSEFNKHAFAVRQIVARLNTMKLVQVMAVHGGGGAVAAPGTVDVMPLFQMYKIHVQDFDLDTTAQITNSPKDLIVRWARDSGEATARVMSTDARRAPSAWAWASPMGESGMSIWPW